MSTEKIPPQTMIKAVPLPEATLVHAKVLPPLPPPTAHPQPHDHRGEDRDTDSCVFQGRFCFYQACSSNLRYRAQAECLCIRKTACLECCLDHEQAAVPRGVGLVTEPNSDEICKVGLHCCDYALVRPRVLFGTASHVLCLRQVGSLPFDPDYLDQPVCAIHCISCYPDCEIAMWPPKCGALNKMHQTGGAVAPVDRMDRGEYGPVVETEFV